MSKPTFQELYSVLQAATGDASAASLVHFKRFVTDAEREIWFSNTWNFGIRTGQLNTAAPYSTGTITATQSSTTITIAGGSLTGLEGYKFSLGVTGPYYRIIAVAGGGASATLEAAYAGATVSTSTFVIYKDEYEFPLEVKAILGVSLMRPGWPALEYVPQADIRRFMTAQGFGIGYPRFYNSDATVTSIATSQEAIVLFLMPAPNNIYPLEYRYYKGVTDMAADTDTPSLPEQFMTCLKSYALYKAYQLDYQMADQGSAAYQIYKDELSTLKQTFLIQPNVQYRLRAFDEARRKGVSLEDNLRRSFTY